MIRTPSADVAPPGEAGEGETFDFPPEYSEDQLAREFADENGEQWLFVAEQGKWYFWDEYRWRPDQTLRAFDLARETARAASIRALADGSLTATDRSRIGRALASAKTTAAVERLARADRRHAMISDAWDSNQWLLNTLSGVVDLRSGKTFDRSPHHRITKLAGARAAGECPTWDFFIERVTGGDRDLAAFLQRFAGYCLTGDTSEHALLFLWGLGANGKSTFATTLMGVLGDYATTAPTETFVESYAERHPTDLAMLRGARLVVVQEVEDGQRWAASKIKQLTGGDRVRARFMRQDYFEYTPRFKLLFCGNHKPSFRHVDEAIRRRFHLVPFTQTIPESDRDPDLVEKLKKEYGGILRWALEGCFSWQEIGLAPPQVVREATDAYMEDEDILLAWLNEHCERDRNAFAPVAVLHKSYQAWAESAGEKFFGIKRFSQVLEDHGYERDRSPGERVRGFRGIRIRRAQERFEAVL